MWRVGRSLGRTLYLNDVCVGMVDTPAIASDIVAKLNAVEGKLGALRKLLMDELDRGYVLTEEPGAGEAWRQRYRQMILVVQQCIDLSRDAGLDRRVAEARKEALEEAAKRCATWAMKRECQKHGTMWYGAQACISIIRALATEAEAKR